MVKERVARGKDREKEKVEALITKKKTEGKEHACTSGALGMLQKKKKAEIGPEKKIC